MVRLSQPVSARNGTAMLGVCLYVLFTAGGVASADVAESPQLSARAARKQIVKQVPPTYPAVAKHNFIRGRVRLEVRVTDRGEVGEAHVMNGHPLLAASALDAVRRWQFRPLQTRSGRSGFRTQIEVNFTLHSREPRQFPSDPEKDLQRQIQPPEIADGPGECEGSAQVRLRVLVGEDGHALDSQPLAGNAAHFDAAQEIVRGWTFRPARWGTIPVPWYLEVEVPVEDWAAGCATADAERRCP